MSNKSYLVIKKNADQDVARSIKRIVAELEKHGRSVSMKGSAPRVLSRYLNDYVRKEKIYFSWNQKNNKSIISLPTNIKLIRIKNNRIKLIHQQEW